MRDPVWEMELKIPWISFVILLSLASSGSGKCVDIHGRSVNDSSSFTPRHADLCMRCICIKGVADACHTSSCRPPDTCHGPPEKIANTCCAFRCYDDQGRIILIGLNDTDPAKTGGPLYDGDGGGDSRLGELGLEVGRLLAGAAAILVLALAFFCMYRMRKTQFHTSCSGLFPPPILRSILRSRASDHTEFGVDTSPPLSAGVVPSPPYPGPGDVPSDPPPPYTPYKPSPPLPPPPYDGVVAGEGHRPISWLALLPLTQYSHNVSASGYAASISSASSHSSLHTPSSALSFSPAASLTSSDDDRDDNHTDRGCSGSRSLASHSDCDDDDDNDAASIAASSMSDGGNSNNNNHHHHCADNHVSLPHQGARSRHLSYDQNQNHPSVPHRLVRSYSICSETGEFRVRVLRLHQTRGDTPRPAGGATNRGSPNSHQETDASTLRSSHADTAFSSRSCTSKSQTSLSAAQSSLSCSPPPPTASGLRAAAVAYHCQSGDTRDVELVLSDDNLRQTAV